MNQPINAQELRSVPLSEVCVMTKEMIFKALCKANCSDRTSEQYEKAKGIVTVLQYTSMKRVFQRIRNFLVKGSGDLSISTAGSKNSIPWWIPKLAGKLDDVLIESLKTYIVVPLSHNYLFIEAFTDWLYVCKERDDLLERWISTLRP
jgi:hypothetical protein